jgi:hypothetical protein
MVSGSSPVTEKETRNKMHQKYPEEMRLNHLQMIERLSMTKETAKTFPGVKQEITETENMGEN